MPETKKYCPHCKEKVSASTYRRHRVQYFNHVRKTWIFTDDTSSLSEDDSEGEA